MSSCPPLTDHPLSCGCGENANGGNSNEDDFTERCMKLSH